MIKIYLSHYHKGNFSYIIIDNIFYVLSDEVDLKSYEDNRFYKIDFYFKCNLYWLYIHNDFPNEKPLIILDQILSKHFNSYVIYENYMNRNVYPIRIKTEQMFLGLNKNQPYELFVEDGINSLYRLLDFEDIPYLIEHKNIENTNIKKLFPELFLKISDNRKITKLINNLTSKQKDYERTN